MKHDLKNHENLTEKITKKKIMKNDEKILWKIDEKSDGKTKNVARFAEPEQF